MFGDLMGMMGKLKETQQKVQQTKERLNGVSLKETGPEGLIEVVITANREIKEVSVDNSLLQDPESRERMGKAGEIHEKELAAVAKEGMPNIPGLDNFLK